MKTAFIFKLVFAALFVGVTYPAESQKESTEFAYGKYSVAIDILSTAQSFFEFSGVNYSKISSNPIIAFRGDMMVTDRTSLGLNCRIGLKIDRHELPNSIPSNSNQSNWILDQAETMFELGFEPTLYFKKERSTFNFHCRPGIYLGYNTGVDQHVYVDNYNFISEGYWDNPTQYHYGNSFNRIYYRIALLFGLQIDLKKGISIGFDFGAFNGSWKNNTQFQYSNSETDPKYKLYLERDWRTEEWNLWEWGGGIQGAVNLIYRLNSN